MSLKNIIYIDYEKVYSFSAQLFEGLVHTATEQQEITIQDSETILVKEKTAHGIEGERKSLSTILNPHDYHYLKFEKELTERNEIFEINDDSIDQKSLLGKSFVKIKAVINLIDYERLKYTTENFHEIGYAINFVHQYGDIQELDILINESQGPTRKKLQETKNEFIRSIKQKSLNEQKEFHGYLSYIFNHAYGDDVEITQKIGNLKVTSFFLKNFFKLPLDMFIKRYSRKTLKEFTIVGMVTQISRDTVVLEEPKEEEEKDSMRKAASNMNDALFDFESTFCEPSINEIFIEPIALYTEV